MIALTGVNISKGKGWGILWGMKEKMCISLTEH